MLAATGFNGCLVTVDLDVDVDAVVDAHVDDAADFCTGNLKGLVAGFALGGELGADFCFLNSKAFSLFFVFDDIGPDMAFLIGLPARLAVVVVV